MPNTKQLIEQTVIFEGLLRNIEARNGQAMPDELALLQAKFDEMSELFYTTFPPFYSDEAAPVAYEPIEEQTTIEPVTQVFEPTTQAYASQPAPQQARVDEALSRRKAEDLSKAFTINDKFRFGKELYGGDTELMNDQIAVIESLGSFQQACDLLYSNNGWNPEEPVVKEFMEIIRRHFQQ